jgi:hypothetical protein
MSHRLIAIIGGAVALLTLSVAADASTTIVTPGENGVLAGAGRYTYIAPSSPRPGGRYGFLYLGDGRASATYQVYAPTAGTYALWIRFDDDGLRAGTELEQPEPANERMGQHPHRRLKSSSRSKHDRLYQGRGDTRSIRS